jgi:hypothetical protein
VLHENSSFPVFDKINIVDVMRSTKKESTVPVIKVWCLPKLPEQELSEVIQGIIRAVVSIHELGLKSEKDMSVIAPVGYHVSSEIIVEVTGLFMKPERTNEVRQRLAEAIGTTVKGLFPKAMVECFVYPFDPTQGFWTNLRERKHKPTKQELQVLSKPVTLVSPGLGKKL